MGSLAASDLHAPGDELLRAVRAVLPPTWPIGQDGLWYLAEPPGVRLPRQGWVVEVSATPRDGEAILHRTATLCGELGVAFQFPLDGQVLRRVTGPTWPRETGGRVMSLYPVDDAQFHQVLERLHTALREFAGPYILSDKRFRDSQVVHYRYGGFPGRGPSVLRVTGERQPMLEAPDGGLVPDERAPMWSPPPWLSDPFPGEAEPDEEADEEADDGLSLNGGRYLIRAVLRSSVTGGVYVGLDRETNAAVTIKEARPHTGIDADGLDAVDRLKRQYRLLQELQDTGFTPAPLDLFSEWEHLFLVEERIRGLSLEEYTAASNPLLRGPGTRAKQEAYAAKFRKIASNLAAGLVEMHARGMVLGPVTAEDVVVTDLDAEWVRVWNLDMARESSEGQAQADDLHVLGTLLADTLCPRSSALIRLDPSRAQPLLALGAGGIGLAGTLEHTILRCLDTDRAQRPTASEVLQVLNQRASAGPASAQPQPQPVPDALQGTLQAAITALRTSADPRPPGQLVPADSLLLSSNPLNLAYGAAGVGYALARLTGSVPGSITERMRSEPAAPDRYPPGLYVGSAGVAWALWEMGLTEAALQTLRSARNHPLLRDAADLFHGAAGYGLACLRFHGLTGNQEWLDEAVAVGEQLLRTRVEKGAGAYWPDREGAVGLGYAKGAAGIGLYLLYLSLATGDRRFLQTGTAALEHDLAHLRPDEPGAHLAMRRWSADTDNAPESCPDWYEGTAGVGTALVRFWHVTREERYRDLLERIAPDAARTYTAAPGLFHGMAGLGNFLLDLYRFTGKPAYLQQAQHAGQTAALFGVKRGAGVAFPGKDATQLTLDFGTGTAGIALFLHRLAHAGEHCDNFNFLPDNLLNGKPGA